MYKYPNRDHYLNSLGKASDVGRGHRRVRLNTYAGHEQYYPQPSRQSGGYLGQQYYQPRQHLDQPVQVVGYPENWFLTKSKSDGIRRVVPLKPNIPVKPNEKSYHGPVLGPNGKVWYVSDKNKAMVRPAYSEAENTMVVNYGQKIAKTSARRQAGPNPGQAQAGRQGKPAKPGKPQKAPRPNITKSPYNVLDATNKMIETLVSLKKKASAADSTVKAPAKFSGTPYYFETLQEGLKKFVIDFKSKERFFSNRNPDAKLGQTLENTVNEGEIYLSHADGWSDLTTEQKLQYHISVLVKLRKNIIAAIRGVGDYNSMMDRRKAAIENIAKAAHVTGAEGADSKEAMIRVVNEAAKKCMEDGEVHMVWSPEVGKRIPVQIVLMMMEQHGLDQAASWTEFSLHAANMKKPQLWKMIMKHEAVFKKAVKKAGRILYNRKKAAEKMHDHHPQPVHHEIEARAARFPTAVHNSGPKPSGVPTSIMHAGARPAPNLFSMYRQSKYDP